MEITDSPSYSKAEHSLRMSDRYSVKASCDNCGHKGTITVPKGTRIAGAHTCPECGCTEFRPDWKLS
jgi:hypothetical protein